MSICINLEELWDKSKVCENPHKGWYLHYFDNGLKVYGSGLAEDDYLEDFPGLNHIYLRLAWSHLEPEEGRFNWDLIDNVLDRWVAHGYKVAFRVTCKETTRDQVFATPEWVKDAGAKGEFHLNYWTKAWQNWEPDYGDPVFLEKLENFHAAFAERYDGKPWGEYIDIGSYGDWGEGHTQVSSRRDWPFEVIREHVDLHLRHYRKSVLFINDDFVGCRYVDTASRERLLDYFVQKGLAIRDDSVCVKLYADQCGFSTLRHPEMFGPFWRSKPVDLEADHYRDTLEDGTWKQGLPFAAAIEEAHASYAGFHGFAREWLEENRQLAVKLANKMGYWYFPESVELPEFLEKEKESHISIVWVNFGAAPAYHLYELEIMLWSRDGGNEFYTQAVENTDNRKWMPDEKVKETYRIRIPGHLGEGVYAVGIGLFEKSGDSRKIIELGLRDSVKGRDGYYFISDIEVKI